MHSVILSYIWQDGVERIAIGWEPMVDAKRRQAKQVIRELHFDHSKEWRQEIKQLNASDLMIVLYWLMDDNEIAVVRPN